MSAIYEPVYRVIGGPAVAYICRDPGGCGKPTKTLRGMLIHLQVCHGQRLQSSFEVSASNEKPGADLPGAK